jgi:hypothetical protein
MARTRSSPSAVEPGQRRDTAAKRRRAAPADPAAIVPDRYRAFVFPNRVREQRRAHGLQKLMALGERLPDIPYIRLSKIERGEVVARADELIRAYEVDSTPTIVVNGKYRFTAATAGGYPQSIELVQWLISKEAAGK